MSDAEFAFAAELALAPKKNADGSVIPACWTTDDGYTIAECRLPEKRWTVTRPGGRCPFLYTSHKPDVRRNIIADRQAPTSVGAS